MTFEGVIFRRAALLRPVAISSVRPTARRNRRPSASTGERCCRKFPARSAMPEEEFTGTSRFRVVARLGAGGMGVVYRVHDQHQHRDVALKTLQRFDATELYR